MPKINTAPFAQTPRTGVAAVTVALAGTTGTTVTGASILVTAGVEGAIVTKITAIPRGTVTATSLRLYLVKASAPTAYHPIDSEVMNAYTQSTTVALPEVAFINITPDRPVRLEAGDKLYVGTEVAQAGGVVFYAEWMDF